MTRRSTVALGVGLAIASWIAMGVILGYGGMQRSISLTLDQMSEVIPAFLAGGVAAFAVCWAVATTLRRLPRIRTLLSTMVVVDLVAVLGALVLFNEVPPERVLVVALDATGGGAQLIGAALGVWAAGARAPREA